MDLMKESPVERRTRRGSKIWLILFAAVSFELGLFLIIFPWMAIWPRNYFASLAPEWERFWMSPYFRGAVSGVGLLNVLIALSEVFNMRHWTHDQG